MRVPWYSCALLLAGLCAFWAGLALATWQFPTAFDWRYMTVSNLFSAKHNPVGYVWGAAGVACCGVMGLCALLSASLSQGRFRAQCPRESVLLSVGFGFMVLAALVPARWLFAKGHDWLAVIAFLSLCAGLVRGIVLAQLHGLPAGAPYRRLRAVGSASAALWPVAGAALSQAHLAIFKPELPWVTIAWRARGIPLILSFALWEWLTCVTLSVCLVLLAAVWAERSALSLPG